MIQEIFDALTGQIHSNQFLSGGLILGAITTFLYSLKSIPLALWRSIQRRVVYKVTIEQSDELYGHLQLWLNHHYKHQLRSVRASYGIQENADHDKTHRKAGSVVYNHYGDAFIIRKYWRFIRISADTERMEHASDFRSLYYQKLCLQGLWSKQAINKLLGEAIQFGEATKDQEKVPRVLYNRYEYWTEAKGATLRDINTIFLAQKDVIMEDVRKFITSREFYQARGIQFRRGYLLHGPPGTGKSSLVSAIAGWIKYDLYTLDLKATPSVEQFDSKIAGIEPKSILLIEDIDSYFDGRKTEGKITFSSFINALSGVKSKSDILLFITTNHPGKLDEALLRPGRLDMHFELSYPGVVEVNAYLCWFYQRNLSLESPVKCSMADVENICVKHKFNPEEAIRELTELTLVQV